MMEAKSTDKRTFRLTDDQKQLGEIVYENLFFLKAEIDLAGFGKYQIAPVGIFGTSIALTKNGVRLASLAMSWNGHIVITFDSGSEYVLKLYGVFSNKYILENENKDKLILIESKFNWREFQYSHDITYHIEYDRSAENLLLLFLSVYSVNFFIATLSGSNAGMM